MRALLAALLFASPAYAGDIVGRASVIDGDTLEIHGQRVRLDGIDAPESWQRCTDARGVDYACGKAAAEALDAFLAASRPTTCREVSKDRYGRSVAICVRDDGAEVNRWLVENGFALDWPRYSRKRYAKAQEGAARAKRGMWVGYFTEPWVERARRR